MTNTNSYEKSDDNKYNLSKSIKSTKTSKSESITKLCNSDIKMKKAFTILDTRISSESLNPPTILKLIEKTIKAQTKY